MTASPSISAIIPVYNGAGTIARAVDSALAQDFDGLEVIVVDDGSTDSTASILHGYGERLRIIRQTNAGPAIARNIGARASKAEYLAFLDADDVWLAGKIAKMDEALSRAPASVLAFSDVITVDEHGAPTGEGYIAPARARAPSMQEMLTHWWPILPSAVMMRRRVFERCGGFRRDFRSPGYEDPFLWLLAREQGPFEYVAEPLVLYCTVPFRARMEKYSRGVKIFNRLVEEHFGPAGAGLIAETHRAHLGTIGHMGLMAMAAGDAKEARQAFLCALRYHPLHVKSMLRYARTFLPQPIANVLTGRTRKCRSETI